MIKHALIARYGKKSGMRVLAATARIAHSSQNPTIHAGAGGKSNTKEG